jgi:lipopolysaccharide cholinephosphotransferase
MDDSNFLREEIRLDFTVSSKRKKLWMLQLDLLKQLSLICEKYNLRYFASNGTLLGAVRHNGFVPWDDDMDIAMPREDYNRLSEIAPNALLYPYFFQNGLTDMKYYRNYARLRNSETTAIPEIDFNNECNNGIFIDIFPIDGCYESLFKRFFQRFGVLVYDKMLNNLTYYERQSRHSLKNRLFHGVCFLFGYTDKEKLFRKLEKLRSQKQYESSELVYMITHGTIMFVWEKAYFEDYTLFNFEDAQIPVPVGYERILETLYGNYHELPPKEARGKRHTIFYDPEKPYKEYLGNLSTEEFNAMINVM